MTTIEDFKEEYRANVEHSDLLLIVADFLQETNSPLADGFRALGRRGFVPWYFTGTENWGAWSDIYLPFGANSLCRLPPDWMKKVKGTDCVLGGDHQWSCKEGTPDHLWQLIEALAKGFSKLPKKRRQELLAVNSVAPAPPAG